MTGGILNHYWGGCHFKYDPKYRHINLIYCEKQISMWHSFIHISFFLEGGGMKRGSGHIYTSSKLNIDTYLFTEQAKNV